MTNPEAQRPVRPRRSVLYVPANSDRAIAKLPSLACDAVVFDLEDAVTPEAKDAARETLRDLFRSSDFRASLGGRETVIRINQLTTPWGNEDFLAARACKPDAILIPKVSEPEDVDMIADALTQTDAPLSLRLWAMIETPHGIMNAGAIARCGRTTGSRLDCFVAGTNDIVKETGVRVGSSRAALSSWLAAIVLAARGYGLDVLDGVYNDFRDADGFARECNEGRDMGFDGKTLIHPSQIAPANDAFGISADALADAEAIIAAFAEPKNTGRGVIQVNGRMVERLHLDMAEKLAAKARLIHDE